MASPVADRQVRISKIAGRYLVFDIDDVVHIRRQHGICSVFTGTMPQNPTQNVFLGLPVELYAEEARLLVDKKAAYIADESADHLSQLKTLDETARREYIASLKSQRRNAQLVFADAKARSLAKHADKRKPSPRDQVAKDGPAISSGPEDRKTSIVDGAGGDTLFDSRPVSKPIPKTVTVEAMPAITPTTSNALIRPNPSSAAALELPSDPLLAYLNARGYFITPGLRFGGDYSVYPGDPFRFHAHYLANSYGWDEEIPMLDLLTSGRLGTAVKKSYLLGAARNDQRAAGGPNVSADGDKGGDEDVRVFCVEWAAM
ncbi:hypothetical protein B0T24DRAFT_176678 [Lasiosphaeria ovina]|uniref:tRNA-splicing endonuclease subunit Sen34 n=1 Tax=Lasiosphaeria ovina TaxID=92902 RepID=A0AAE0NED0_9PEZI|nr:hypothetical protein B0T24DRAFT_176678 [Lasiosphaeria ovina]